MSFLPEAPRLEWLRQSLAGVEKSWLKALRGSPSDEKALDLDLQEMLWALLQASHPLDSDRNDAARAVRELIASLRPQLAEVETREELVKRLSATLAACGEEVEVIFKGGRPGRFLKIQSRSGENPGEILTP